ncbi:MAG: hypothetical protein JST01_01905 [Cyanobacteria bacterium SZAS TMP-1]|nr:hypothetical protein [Cyanobacteria bacterium SZAS TMP-1]
MMRILQISVLLLCCIGSSVLTWFFTSRYDYDRYAQAIAEFRAKQIYPVVYCRKDIPANTEITSEYLEFRRVPENILPANACESISVVLGRKAKYPIKKGSALFLADFGLLDLAHLNSVPTTIIQPK